MQTTIPNPVPTAEAAVQALPPSTTQLLQYAVVPTAELQAYAPADQSLPLVQYAMQTVMAWGQAQPNGVGAIPTWEVEGNAPYLSWGVVLIYSNPSISVVDIPTADWPSTETDPTVNWAQGAARWAAAQNQGYQLCIPTFTATDTTRQALVFGADYPGLQPITTSNASLYNTIFQARYLVNLYDPATWAQTATRFAGQSGYLAAWPTWEWNTSRSLVALSEYAPLPLPQTLPGPITWAAAVMGNMGIMLSVVQNSALNQIGSLFAADDTISITDPGLTLGLQSLFGIITSELNGMPGVGGALAAVVSLPFSAAVTSAAGAGIGNAPMSLAAYQAAIASAFGAAIQEVSILQNDLSQASGVGQGQNIQPLWATPLLNPLTGQSAPLGMLGYSSQELITQQQPWQAAGSSIGTSFLAALKQLAVQQNYGVVHRTYQNRPPDKQWWNGTIASVTAANGPVAAYIAGSDDDRSCWFNNFVQESGYVEMDEFWMVGVGPNNPEYPVPDLVYSLFNGDGFGNVVGWTGPFEKSAVYTAWPIQCTEAGDKLQQQWTYFTNGNLVTAIISSTEADNPAWGIVGYTDALGNVTLANPDNLQSEGSSSSGFAQPVLQNALQYL